MKKEVKNDNQINWREPAEDRPYYIDLAFKGRIYVSKEMFHEYMRPEWADWKRNERSSRCQVPNGHGGVKRCDQDCKQCPYFRNGKTISIDELYEKYEMELADDSQSIIDTMVEEERNNALWNAVATLEPTDQKIMKLFSEGFSERDMSDLLHLPRTTISYRKNKCFEILRELLKDYQY